MKNYKGITTYLALAILVLPGISLANSQVYSEGGFYEAAPVKTQGEVISTTGGYTQTMINPADALPTNILGIHIKTKAERDADRAAEEAAQAKAAEEQRVARNADGTFAYGYTNGSGAQYASGAQYVNARSVAGTRNGARNVAAAGTNSLAGFFPTTFWGWAGAILLLIILLAIIRALMSSMNANNPRAHAHAH